MANVLLLRAPVGQEDRYEAAFKPAGYHPLSVPVLETAFTNLSKLREILKNGPQAEHFDSVIITSGRACEAWKKVVQELLESVSEVSGVDWSSVPFYVVGHGTAAALAEVREAYGETPFTPKIIRGEPSGTGERLAHLILDEPQGWPKKALYLTGDKNRDTIPKILEEVGIELQPLQVYGTQGSSTFEQDLKKALDNATKEHDRWWIIHFAPSAAGFVTPILHDHFDLRRVESNKARSITSPRIAAIGPVTSSFMLNELNIPVDVTAPNPTPQDLVAAIIENDLESGF